MHITTTKSKNAESFYITKTYKTNTGATTSKIVRKLGTLQELSEKLDTDREGVMVWEKQRTQAKPNYTDGAFYRWGRHPACIFPLSRQPE